MTKRVSLLLQSPKFGPVQAFERAVGLHAHGRLSEAEQLYHLVLAADARHFDAAYQLGLIRLQQSRFAEAEALFARAVKLSKRSAEAHHHLAVALTGLQRLEEAIPRYEKALALKPNYAEAHNNLGHTLQMLERHAEAARHYEKAIAADPSYVEAFNNLGNALAALGSNERAIAQYHRALTLNPAFDEARNGLAHALAAQQFDPKKAGQEARALVGANDANLLSRLGDIYLATHEFELASSSFHAALALDPNLGPAAYGLASATSALDQHEQAASLLLGLIQRGIRRLDALMRLANLPGSAPGFDLITELQDALAKADNEQSIEIAFALASALDKAGRYPQAWRNLEIANRRMFARMQTELAEEIKRQRSSLAALLAYSGTEAQTSGDSTAAPPISLFILGASRSGKSTVEKLVATLGGVKRGYENPNITKALERTLRAGGGVRDDYLENLPPPLYGNFLDNYLGELAQRAGSAKVFTNTYPALIHAAHLLPAICPNVRFLLVKRNEEDNVFRICMKNYRKDNAYAYNLQAAARYVAWYEEMIDVLTKKLPAITRVVHYEDVVADPAAALRAVGELCGLPVPGDGPLPAIGDDRGCAEPYRAFMAAALE